MLFVEYPTCTTCKRAKKYLESHHIEFTARNIKEENPTAAELGLWQPKSGKAVKAFSIRQDKSIVVRTLRTVCRL